MSEVTQDGLLNNAVKIYQPKDGYRVSVDSVFLSAAIDIKNGSKLLDMGCGVGAISLCLAERLEQKCSILGIDIQQNLLDLGLQNIEENNVSDSVSFMQCDVQEYRKFDLKDGSFDQIITNPPYLEENTHNPSPNNSRAIANATLTGITLKRWIKIASILLKHGGYFTLVQRTDRLDDIIDALKSSQMGSIVLYPLWSKSNQPSKRIIVQARKEKYAPTKLCPGIIIHENNGHYTNEAHDILFKSHAINLNA